MKKVIGFYALVSVVFLAACTKLDNKNNAAGTTVPDETVKEIATIAGVPILPKSMDLFAKAEQLLADGQLRMAAKQIESGIKALRGEIGSEKLASANEAIGYLVELRAKLAADQPVSKDDLHKAVVAALEFAPIVIQDSVIQRNLEVDKPGGAIPKMYKKTGL